MEETYKTNEVLDLTTSRPGPRDPQHNPDQSPAHDPPLARTLGRPMGVVETAELVGCSAWTVRQVFVRDGLPHFRSGPNGKLIFYQDQVVRWILGNQQSKGGHRR